MTQQQNITEMLIRLEKRKRECFINPNQFYKKGTYPTEYQDILAKVKELKKIIKDN